MTFVLTKGTDDKDATDFVYVACAYDCVAREKQALSIQTNKTTKQSSPRRIMGLVPVVVLETAYQTNNKCLPQVRPDGYNAPSSIKTANLAEWVRENGYQYSKVKLVGGWTMERKKKRTKALQISR